MENADPAGQQRFDFVSLFAEEYERVNPVELASLFSSASAVRSISTRNSEVKLICLTKAKEAFDNTFRVLNTY
jgi:hypothetical protein